MIPHILAVEIGITEIGAILAILVSLSAWMVIPWRVGSLEKRLDAVEADERDHSSRMVAVETELKNINAILARIERVLTDGRGSPHGNE